MTARAILALGMKVEQDISHVVFTMLELSFLQINAVHVVVENLNTPGLSRFLTLMKSMMVKSVHTLWSRWDSSSKIQIQTRKITLSTMNSLSRSRISVPSMSWLSPKVSMRFSITLTIHRLKTTILTLHNQCLLFAQSPTLCSFGTKVSSFGLTRQIQITLETQTTPILTGILILVYSL